MERRSLKSSKQKPTGPISRVLARYAKDREARARQARREMGKGSESRRALEGALYDLYMDSEERPKLRKEFGEVRAVVARHCGAEEGKRWIELHARMDKALRSKLDPDESGLVQVTEDLGEIYLMLRASVLG